MDVSQKGFSKILGVVAGLALRDDDIAAFGGTLHKRLEQLHRFWCRGDNRPWPLADAETELQLVPRLIEVPPCGHLVTPGDTVLGAPQSLRFLGRERGRLDAVRPNDSALAWLIERPVRVRADRQDSRRPLEHDVSDIRRRRPDKCDVLDLAGFGDAANPLCAGKALAP